MKQMRSIVLFNLWAVSGDRGSPSVAQVSHSYFFVAGRDECVTYPINYLQGGREYLATDKSQSQTKKLLKPRVFYLTTRGGSGRGFCQ